MVKRYTLINGLLHYVRTLDEHKLFSGEKQVVLASDYDEAIAALEDAQSNYERWHQAYCDAKYPESVPLSWRQTAARAQALEAALRDVMEEDNAAHREGWGTISYESRWVIENALDLPVVERLTRPTSETPADAVERINDETLAATKSYTEDWTAGKMCAVPTCASLCAPFSIHCPLHSQVNRGEK